MSKNYKLKATKPKVVWHSLTKASIYTEIYISAPASLVWKTMMDAKNMPKWSRTFQGFSGDFGLNKIICLSAYLPKIVPPVRHSRNHHPIKDVIEISPIKFETELIEIAL